MSLLRKLNMSLNTLALLAGGILCCFVFYYAFTAFSSKPEFLDHDRSTTYNVKIFSPTLDDAALAQMPKEAFSYVAVIDAGSSGCRAHVYRYGKLGSIDGPLYILPNHVSKKVKPGLSSFANNPTAAGASLADLVLFLKDQVPETDWSVTPVWLKATAGLRMTPEKQREQILGSVRSFLSSKKNSPFLFKPEWAKVIPGKEEGAFGWLAFNYLKRLVGPKKDKTKNEQPYAVVEMGGASTQVTQLAPNQEVAKQIPPEYRFDFEVEGEKFTLYTYSYLGFGAEQAREALNKVLLQHYLVQSDKESRHGNGSKSDTAAATEGAKILKDPCLNRGYSRAPAQKRVDIYDGLPADSLKQFTAGTSAAPSLQSLLHIEGDSDQSGTCLKALSKIFPENIGCSNSKKEVSFNCIYQPDFLVNSQKFLVFENFYYVASGIGVMPKGHAPTDVFDRSKFPVVTSPSEMLESTVDVCAATYDSLQANYPRDNQPKELNTKWCFASSYTVSLLLDGLKLDKDKEITIQKEVDGNEIEWALGAAYKETADFLRRSNLRPVY